MRLNEAGVALKKRMEGFRSYWYQDGGGVWTIGYGTTFGRNVNLDTAKALLAEEFGLAEPISEAQATKLMVSRTKSVTRYLYDLGIDFTDNQFNALICFIYNIGLGQFESSTMLSLLRKGDFEGASEEFDRWTYTTENGKKVKSEWQVKRRAAERQLFLTPDISKTYYDNFLGL